MHASFCFVDSGGAILCIIIAPYSSIATGAEDLNMPFSVLKISKTDEKQIEVLGEFWDTEVAQKFADFMQTDGEGGDFDYVVETPHPVAPPEAK